MKNTKTLITLLIILLHFIVLLSPFITIYFIVDRFLSFIENLKGVKKEKKSSLEDHFSVNKWVKQLKK